MKFDSEDIESGQLSLKRLSEFLKSSIPIFSEYAKYFSLFSASLSEATSVVDNVYVEREFLYKLLLSMMLDKGIYDYILDKETIGSTIGYNISIESLPESVKISVEFPETTEVEGENDTNT